MMKQASNNTSENRIGAGLSEEQILEAVRKSGYPLQTIIASALNFDFSVKEEWSYIDSDSNMMRSLDIVASRRLFVPDNDKQPFVRPTLSLLIECKQSDLPYLFFMSVATPWLRFPVIAGLAQDTLKISTDDSRSTWSQPIMQALDLAQHPFVTGSVDTCTSVSKCVRKGKEVELSGSDAFQNIVLPMVKALRYFKTEVAPPQTARYFDCHLALGIAVIDAPMIAAKIEGTQNSLNLVPWVRVIRHEANESEHWTERTQTFAVDVVHKSFFDKYLQQHAIPFAQAFAPLAIKHDLALATGKGFVSGMEKNPLHIEGRLRLK